MNPLTLTGVSGDISGRPAARRIENWAAPRCSRLNAARAPFQALFSLSYRWRSVLIFLPAVSILRLSAASLSVALPPHLRKWWLFSREDKGELHVVFCDLGIGIPRSLFREDEKVARDWMERLKSWLAERVTDWHQADDALKIKAAVEIGQTRTGLPHRGKGLKQMVGFLDAVGNNAAKVTIYSGSGVYRRMPKKGKQLEFLHALSDKETTITGTMISWSIPLPDKEAIL